MKIFLHGIFFLALLSPAMATAEDNAIYKELTEQGVALANGKTIKLPPPVMADGLKSDQQKAVLTQVGPKNNAVHEKEFSRGNPNDWYEIKQASETGDNPNGSIGRTVDLYFVAKGKLQTVANPNFIKQQMQQTKQKKIDFYIPAELQLRKLTVKDTSDTKERYVHGLLTPDDLFGEVQVGGTAHGVETLNPESILIAFKLDPRFDKDSEFPNQYQKAKTDPLGNIVLDPPKPYDGFGGYAKLTKLQGPDDRIFVEYHLVFDEPHEWFNGTQQLVSKLETSYTTNIRKFRRDVNPPAAAANAPAGNANVNNQPQAPANTPQTPANNSTPAINNSTAKGS
ncbi:MAG TPA: hypothetical protein VMJ32_08540 [Pirellulales bacterium]|nr:hypothetical protein [Pirellulales bacterium]